MSSFEGLRLLSIGTALAGMELAEEFRLSLLSVRLVMHRVCFGLSLLSAELSWNLLIKQSCSCQTVFQDYTSK